MSDEAACNCLACTLLKTAVEWMKSNGLDSEQKLKEAAPMVANAIGQFVGDTIVGFSPIMADCQLNGMLNKVTLDAIQRLLATLPEERFSTEHGDDSDAGRLKATVSRNVH